MDFQTPAAKSFYREVRKFAEDLEKRPWKGGFFHEVQLGEIHDLTLVSRRLYGRSDETLAVMAAAGLNSHCQPLRQAQRLALPDEAQLTAIKRRTGFESRAIYREGDRPVWAG